MTFLLTGGTGTLGRLVVARLRAADLPVRVLSRRDRDHAEGIEFVTGDLIGGEGVESAVEGVETVVHLAGGPKGDDAATRTLARAASRAGVRHLVAISVVGADRMPLGYFRAKLGAERAVADSGVPWTLLRAAQFHTLVDTVARSLAKSPVLPAPSAVRFEPVDAAEVADRITELALGAAQGRVPDLAGPQAYPMGDLLRTWLRLRGKRRLLAPLPVPGAVGRAYRAGENLAQVGADRGVRTWEDFLAAQESGRR